jgi:hypothetical protein
MSRVHTRRIERDTRPPAAFKIKSNQSINVDRRPFGIQLAERGGANFGPILQRGISEELSTLTKYLNLQEARALVDIVQKLHGLEAGKDEINQIIAKFLSRREAFRNQPIIYRSQNTIQMFMNGRKVSITTPNRFTKLWINNNERYSKIKALLIDYLNPQHKTFLSQRRFKHIRDNHYNPDIDALSSYSTHKCDKTLFPHSLGQKELLMALDALKSNVTEICVRLNNQQKYDLEKEHGKQKYSLVFSFEVPQTSALRRHKEQSLRINTVKVFVFVSDKAQEIITAYPDELTAPRALLIYIAPETEAPQLGDKYDATKYPKPTKEQLSNKADMAIIKCDSDGVIYDIKAAWKQ